MVCKSCGGVLLDPVKVKRGRICRYCYDGLPESAKANVRRFTADQVRQIRGLAGEPEGEKILASCGAFKVTRSGVQLNGKAFKLKDLSGVGLNFHPSAPGLVPGTVSGTPTVVIHTKAPHYMFEEPFCPTEVIVHYQITGKNIEYGFPLKIERLFFYIGKCLDKGSQDLTSYIDAYFRATRGKNSPPHGEPPPNDAPPPNDGPRRKPRTELEMAEELFGITPPYTAEKIRHTRNILLKKYHPDLGGSEELTKKINAAYRLLMKHAS